MSFNREYESVWAGSATESFYNGDVFDRSRVLKQPEFTRSGRGNDGAYYVLGVDVARNGCQTVITVVKVNPQKKGIGIKSVVNIVTIESEHFRDQANEIKRQYLNYSPRMVVVDGNGLGVGLVDFLVMPTSDEKTGEDFAAFEVANDDKKIYKNIDNGGNTYGKALWIVKADAELNFEGYTALLQQMGSGKLRFLENERDAKASLVSKNKYKTMAESEKINAIKPFTLTSVLKTEMMNLTRPETNSIRFSLVPINTKIGKDKVSSLMYAIYVIKLQEDKDRNRKKTNLASFVFYN